MPDNHPENQNLFVPGLARFYQAFAQPLAWVLLRVFVGGTLILEGWPKIVAPMAQTGFVESIGFYPGWLWSPALAVMQFFGGIAIAIGLFTRPIALANAIMLAITYWFHANHPYGTAFLTPLGVDSLKLGGELLFTPEGVQRLADGGTRFLTQVQHKAEFLSAIWTVATLFFAAYGAGPWSVDRNIIRRHF